MRGGSMFWNFESYNPPISRDNWANIDMRADVAAGLLRGELYIAKKYGVSVEEARAMMPGMEELTTEPEEEIE